MDRIYEGDLPSGLESLFTSLLFVRQPDKTYSALAAAKLGDEGGAFAGSLSTSPGIWINQLSDVGLALEPTAKGTKHYRDDDLK